MSQISDTDRKSVIARAGQRCEYCRTHQSFQIATFHIEHIIPRSKGGNNHLDNLALACPSCNLAKFDCIAIFDGPSASLIPLFHPRNVSWSENFFWIDIVVHERTAIGRVTIERLKLNSERRRLIRAMERSFGLFPPDESIGEFLR